MSTFNQVQEHKHFEYTLTSDSVSLKQVESDLSLKVDESNEIINEVLDSMLNHNDQSKHDTNNEVESHDDLNTQFQDYLKVMSSKSKGFQCQLGIDNDGVVNAIFWTSSTMRSKFERVGSCICINVMERELNALKCL